MIKVSATDKAVCDVNRPPFSAPGAMAARQHMGLSPQQVTRQMRLCGVRVSTELVVGWECGTHRPTERQLFVLADVLWCSTTDLMGIEPRTLVEHRLARRLSSMQLAQQICMDPAAYVQAEAHNRWSGTFRQTLRLADALCLSLRQLVGIIGAVDELADHLHACVKGRWKPHVLAVAEIVNLSQSLVGGALQTLHTEYARASRRVTVHPAAQIIDLRLDSPAEYSAFRQRLVDCFWDFIGEAGEARPFLTARFTVHGSGHEAAVRVQESISVKSWTPIRIGCLEAPDENYAVGQEGRASCRTRRLFQWTARRSNGCWR